MEAGKVRRAGSRVLSRWERFWKQSYKPILLITGISMLALSVLLRTGMTYRDDLLRAVDGYRNWYLGNRYINDILSAMLHAGRKISDISPLPQILAVFIASIAAYLTILVFADGKRIGWLQITAVLPRVLFPYFLVCLSYKFDAPYMALSVLAGTVPLLYVQNRARSYLLASFLGTLVTCMTYQASLGIYPVLVLFLIFGYWMKGKWKAGTCFRILGISIVSYLGALVIYRVLLVRYAIPYAQGKVFPLRTLPVGVLANYRVIYRAFRADLNRVWKLLFLVLVISYFISVVVNTKRNRLVSALMCLFCIITSSFLVVGPLIAFEGQNFIARYSYGIGTPFLAMAVCLSFTQKFPIGKIAFVGISWCFVVYSLTYGNAVSEQMHYVDERCLLIMEDMNNLPEIKNSRHMEYLFTGTCGYSPSIKKLVRRTPMLKRMMLPEVGKDYFGGYYFATHYMDGAAQFNPYILVDQLTDRRVVKDTRFHTIEQEGSVYVVHVKK